MEWPDDMEWEGEKAAGFGRRARDLAGFQANIWDDLFIGDRTLHGGPVGAEGASSWRGNLTQQEELQQQQQEGVDNGQAEASESHQEAWWQQPQQEVLVSGWELVLEHRCWYEYSLWLLVHVAVQLQLKGGGTAGTGADERQAPQQDEQQLQLQELTKQGTAAAAFISWVLEPWSELR
jgi:hypothetical protein